MKTKKYLNGNDLTFEIIISKGKGQLTEKAQLMLIMIAENLSKKFYYINEDDRYDCKVHAILHLFEKWKGFKEEKFPDAFPYFTELCKRALADGLNEINQKKWNVTPLIISINKFTIR